MADSSFGKKQGAAGACEEQDNQIIKFSTGKGFWHGRTKKQTAWGESPFLLRSSLSSLSVSDLGGIILREVRVMARTHSLIMDLESLSLEQV